MKLRHPQREHAPLPKTVETTFTKESRSESHYDPTKEISETDWEQMKQILHRHRGTKWKHRAEWNKFSTLAHDLCTLFPERKDELGLDTATFNILQREMLNLSGTDWWTYSDYAVALSLLYPEHKNELGLDSELTWNGIMQEIDNFRQQNDWWNVSNIAANLITLYPERRNEIGLTEADFNNIIAEIKSKQNESWWGVTQMTRNLMLMFPGCRDRLMLDQTWDGMIQYASEQHPGLEWYSGLAADLQVISADDVEVTDQGIKLIYRNKLDRTDPLPVRNIAA